MIEYSILFDSVMLVLLVTGGQSSHGSNAMQGVLFWLGTGQNPRLGKSAFTAEIQ